MDEAREQAIERLAWARLTRCLGATHTAPHPIVSSSPDGIADDQEKHARNQACFGTYCILFFPENINNIHLKISSLLLYLFHGLQSVLTINLVKNHEVDDRCSILPCLARGRIR